MKWMIDLGYGLSTLYLEGGVEILTHNIATTVDNRAPCNAIAEVSMYPNNTHSLRYNVVYDDKNLKMTHSVYLLCNYYDKKHK